METINCDILILGSGGAGLFAAHRAHDTNKKLKIVVASKGMTGKCGCTRMVQGGYNAVLNPDDSIELHFLDTLKGGMMLNNQELAWTMVNDAPGIINELENTMGCFFDKNRDGTIHQKPFAGQSFDRTVHKSDLTGIEIMNCLRNQLFSKDTITCLDETRGLEIFLKNNKVCGCLLLNIISGTFIYARTKAIIVATGGGASMYPISATSLEKTADGMAMAYRCGATFVDMEMMQFHPTGLIVKDAVLHGAVLEEGLRGAGAQLFNAKNERFMTNYDPENMERSTRDRIARASYLEIIQGRGTNNNGIFIDAAVIGKNKVLKLFPGMVERCRLIGKDLSTERIEISPTAHYHMGGIKIDRNCNSTIEGLFSAGEDSGGVHGANRLGGNGVADSTVFGARSGEAAANYAPGCDTSALPEKLIREKINNATKYFSIKSDINPYDLEAEIKQIMWESAGLVRNKDSIIYGLKRLDEYHDKAGKISVSGTLKYNLFWQKALDVTSIIPVAKMILTSALRRTESRGSHYREDHPYIDNKNWLNNIELTNVDNSINISLKAVDFKYKNPHEIFGSLAEEIIPLQEQNFDQHKKK